MLNFFNRRIFILFIFPFILGGITFLNFSPFNLFFINAISLSTLFYLIYYVKKKTQSSYRKKPFLKNLFFLGSSFGFSFFLFGIYWISHSLTFDDSFKFLHPDNMVVCQVKMSRASLSLSTEQEEEEDGEESGEGSETSTSEGGEAPKAEDNSETKE